MAQTVRRIAMVVLDENADLLDLAGPADVFHTAARHLKRTDVTSELAYCVECFSSKGGLVRTQVGIRVDTNPVRELSDGEYDTIIVSGADFDVSSRDPTLVAWLRRNHATARRVGSVCTGAFLLGHAGLLNGRTATTHWMDCKTLQSSFPEVDVKADAIFVEDRGVWTSAGIASGTDMALAMVEQDFGHDLAMTVARNLVVFLKRPGNQSQFSTALRTQTVEGPLAPLLHWIAGNPAADLSAEALAERARMSLRNFFRAFQEATGMPPAEWVKTVRMEIAKRLLEQTDQSIDQVARKAGFSNYEQMRRAFARNMGTAPAAYRARFGRPKREQNNDTNLRLLVQNADI